MGLINQTPQAYYNGNNYGDYQFTALEDVINQFVVAYIGEDKIIPKAKRLEVAFHAQRAMQELSFDTFKSCKAFEYVVPPTLKMPLPQDYVNYTRVMWVDNAGIKHPIYPTKHTQNPTNYFQNEEGGFQLTVQANVATLSSTVVLDDFYEEIRIGDAVQSSIVQMAGSYIIASHTKVAGVSNITLSNQLPIVVGPPSSVYTATTAIEMELVIESQGGILRNKVEFFETDMDGGDVYAHNGYSHNYMRFTDISGNPKPDAISGLKVGMVLTSDSFVPSVFPVGSKVTAISNNIVYFDKSAILASALSGGVTTPVFFSGDVTDSTTWNNYKSATPSENNNDYDNNTYWPAQGERYGLDPQHSQVNGSYYIDCKSGNIHFSSNISGKTVVLEEALYKWIIYGIVSTRADIPEYVVKRYKKEKFAETRKAKLRLSNIKPEEITQILRGKSKQIKH